MNLPRVPPSPGQAPLLPERYRRGPLLGQGGMGVVYRARDEVLGVDVAVKVIRPDLASDSRVRERFLLEVRFAARLTHPNLVPLHDLGTLADGTPFFAMALADAGSLATSRAGWEETKSRITDVLAALGALHARGVLHRDLKPENVLLHRGRALVADLGLAEVADTLARRTYDLAGTPEYMAPEQRAGRSRELGPWTDLYAVGRILDRLTWGIPVPPGLEEVLGWLLHPEPYARWELAADVRRALDALGPPVAVRESAPHRATSVAPTLFPSFAIPERDVVTPSLSDLPTLLDPDPSASPVPPPPGTAVTPLPPGPMPEEPPPEAGRGAHARASLALLALREVPLVAREEVRARLWALAREVSRSRAPIVVLLVGEAGAGKTRLSNSLAWALEEGGWMETARLAYRSPPTADDGYGGAVRRWLRPTGESADSLEERLLRQLLRDFGPATPTWAARMRRWCGLLYDGETPADRAQALALLWERFRRRGWRGGTCLLLDDAHLAEGSEGLSIARNLLDQAAGGDPVPVLVLATLRSEALAANPALARQVAGLLEDGAVRIDLPRLDRAGTAQLVGELLTLTPDLAELVGARCEGNPLLARLLLSGWADEGLLVDGGDLQHGLRPGLDVATALPDNTAGMFARRIAALLTSADDPRGAREALHALSLASSTLPVAVFKGIAGPAGPHLERSGLFRRDGGLVSWDHGLLQEAVRREAAARPDERAQHARIARAWAAWGQEGGAYVDDQVGLHLVEAGDARTALGLLLPACRRAEQGGRMAALLRLATAAQRAADLLGPSAQTPGREARYLRARALTVRGELDAAAKLVEEADGVADADPRFATLPRGILPQDLLGDRPVDDPAAAPVEAYAAWVRGHLHRLRGRLDDAVVAFSDARERWLALGDREGAANAALQLAGCRRHAHRYDEALSLYEESLAGWRALGQRRGEAYVLREMGVLAAWRGETARADELYAQCRALFRAAGEATGEGVAMMRQSQRALASGRPDVAAALLHEAMHQFVANGALLEVQNCRNDLAEVSRQRGDLAGARAGYRAAVRWSEERGWREFTAIGRVNLALVALADEDPLEALAEADHLVEALAATRNHWLRPFAEVIRAASHAQLGHGDEATSRLRKARKRGLGAQADRDLAWVLDRLAREASGRGWTTLATDAAALADRVRPAPRP